MSLWGVYSTHLCLREPNSWIMLFSVVSSVSVSHSSTGGNTHTHTHTLWRKQRHTYTHLHIHIHSHTQNVWRTDLAAARLPPVFFFFFPCSFLNRTCLKFQALTQSVPGRLICNAVHRRGYLFWGSHMHVHERTEMHTQAAACACVSTGAAKRRNPCKPAD